MFVLFFFNLKQKNDYRAVQDNYPLKTIHMYKSQHFKPMNAFYDELLIYA